MRAMAYQITTFAIGYSTVYSRRRSRKTWALRLCEGNSPVTGEFPTQRASNSENLMTSSCAKFVTTDVIMTTSDIARWRQSWLHGFQYTSSHGLRAGSIWRRHLTSIGNPIVEIRRSDDRLISTMGFPLLVRSHLYTESGPCMLWIWRKIPLAYITSFPIYIQDKLYQRATQVIGTITYVWNTLTQVLLIIQLMNAPRHHLVWWNTLSLGIYNWSCTVFNIRTQKSQRAILTHWDRVTGMQYMIKS